MPDATRQARGRARQCLAPTSAPTSTVGAGHAQPVQGPGAGGGGGGGGGGGTFVVSPTGPPLGPPPTPPTPEFGMRIAIILTASAIDRKTRRAIVPLSIIPASRGSLRYTRSVSPGDSTFGLPRGSSACCTSTCPSSTSTSVVSSSSSTETSKVVPRTDITAVGVRTRLGFGILPKCSIWIRTRPTSTSRKSFQLGGFLRNSTRELGKTSKVLPSETWSMAWPSTPVMIRSLTWTASPTDNAHGCESLRIETWPLWVTTFAA